MCVLRLLQYTLYPSLYCQLKLFYYYLILYRKTQDLNVFNLHRRQRFSTVTCVLQQLSFHRCSMFIHVPATLYIILTVDLTISTLKIN
jgi:hypothetical protein